MGKKMSNHIEEYFTEVEKNSSNIASKQLFSGDEEDIDFKTDLTDQDIRDINTLFVNDNYLIKKGLKPVFKNYYQKFMRLVISKERKSRQEFVNLNKQETSEDVINQMSNLSNLTGVRK